MKKDKLVKDYKKPKQFLRAMRSRIASRPKRKFGSRDRRS